MTAATRACYNESCLVECRFENEAQLPSQYLYLESTESGRPLLSVYLGYYPGQGLLDGMPHEPAVCYRSHGWDVEQGPQAVSVPAAGAEAPFEIFYMRVRKDLARRTVLYWFQRAGRRPSGAADGGGWQAEEVHGLDTGRSDLMLVRLEADPDRFWLPIDDAWAAAIRGHVLAIDAALR